MVEKELTVIELTEQNISSMVYEIRGQKVMLDFDLARIYGYSTKAFNQQVKNNIEKFPEDFMFQLNETELKNLVMSKILTSQKSEIESEKSLWCQNITLKNSGAESKRNERSKFLTPEKSEIESEEISRPIFSTTKNSAIESEESLWSKILTLNKSGNLRGQHIKYLPYAFTEQGIYMLMTVLKGELAVKQSKALIRLFKRMKEDIVESNNLLTSRDILELTNRVCENTKDIESLKRKGATMEKKLTKVMDNFIDPSTYKHFLILDGQKIEADIAYQTIYSLAGHTIHIIDDYIGIKTLHLLLSTSRDIQITILSDNVSRNPVQPEYVEDFKKETGINLTMKPSNNRCHDRFVLIDYRTEKEKIYLCGSSSKDAGKRATTIIEIKQDYINHAFFDELIK